jgi:asparagine N-glycosylation enzyme membrane subunit Stt3
VGGLIAGTLDLTAAYISYGANVPRGIAAGLLGPGARQGGLGPYILGIFIHFFIAMSAAFVFYLASQKLGFMIQHPVVCGLFFGIALFLVMNLIVLPLSAIHFKGPYTLRGLIQGLLIHMICIGLPISFSVRQFSK